MSVDDAGFPPKVGHPKHRLLIGGGARPFTNWPADLDELAAMRGSPPPPVAASPRERTRGPIKPSKPKCSACEGFGHTWGPAWARIPERIKCPFCRGTGLAP